MKSNEDYRVAWICALPLEATAAQAVLEKTHSRPPQPVADDNNYTFGEIAGHDVVIACLPYGVYGKGAAATVIAQMRMTFPSIRFALLVGIGGGVPKDLVPGLESDIRLGDIVVSKPTGTFGGVVQYDYGKTVSSGVFQRSGTMNQPPQVLLTAISQMEANSMLGNTQSIGQTISTSLRNHAEITHGFSRPTDGDHLYQSSYSHTTGEPNCKNCDKSRLIHRQVRKSDEPQVHYGLIASGDQVMKDSQTRDRLANEMGILCFEMEAAGIVNQLPSLVIRGICDYCDSHKNKAWQAYAALSAAAYAKILLSVVPPNQTSPSQSSRKACWLVPFERNVQFIGRKKEMGILQDMIFNKDHVRKAAITGLGGVGKTHIALEIVYRVREKRPRWSIFWIPSTTTEAIEQAFMNISEQLGLQNVTPATAKTRVRDILSSETAGSWLLVIDNADDMSMWISTDGSSPALKDLLPQSPCGFTIFTTRDHQLAGKMASANIVSIPQMDNSTARDLLHSSLVQKDQLHDEVSVAKLIDRLCGLPLAITQAASYVNENLMSIEKYLLMLDAQENDMIELLSQDFEDGWRYKETQNPIAVTWLISFRQIRRLNPLAADYLSFMSCLDPKNISQALLPIADSPVKQENALGLLRAYSFITSQGHSISFHRLVHLATRNWLRNEGLLSEYTIKAGNRLAEVFPSNEQGNRILWRAYLPHAQCGLDSSAFKEKKYLWKRLAEKVVACLILDGRYAEAKPLAEEVVRNSNEQCNANENPKFVGMFLLASIYEKQGKWAEAEKLQLQVMEITKRTLGLEDPTTLTNLSNLAMTYERQGRWAEAEQLQLQVLETSERVLDSKHPNILLSIHNLASTYRAQGRWAEAEKLGVQAVEKSRKIYGSEDQDTLNSIKILSIVYYNQGKWIEAEQLQSQVTETSRRILGSDHPDTLVCTGNLATTYRAQCRWAEAEKLQLQVVESSKRILGLEHPDTLVCMSNLASTYSGQERWAEAEELELQVVESSKKVLGSEHPDTLMSLSNLALTYWSQGKLREAEEMELQVMELNEKILGPDHPNTLTSIDNLASTYKSQGRWAEAEKLKILVMKAQEITLGIEHPNTFATAASLTSMYRSQGKLDEAEKLDVQFVEVYKKVLGPEHPKTLTSMHSLSRAWKKQGQDDAAMELLSECLNIQLRVLGNEDPATRASVEELQKWQAHPKMPMRSFFSRIRLKKQ